MELVLLKCTLESLTILEVLYALSIEHSIHPAALVLFLIGLPVKDAITRLNTIFEVAFVAATIAPPKHSSAISLTSFELTFVHVGIFA
jgi:hypothetical protein